MNDGVVDKVSVLSVWLSDVCTFTKMETMQSLLLMDNNSLKKLPKNAAAIGANGQVKQRLILHLDAYILAVPSF